MALRCRHPTAVRRVSRSFWTPVSVARRAAELFQDAGARRVLDVGSGVGKFVLAAAASAASIDFVGVEQRSHLIGVARTAAFKLGIANARFRLADVTRISWSGFDGLYFFNPLAENLFSREDRIDDRVELTEARFLRDMLRVEHALRKARLGTLVVTYHGTSTRMPSCYELQLSERAGTDWLRLWMKKRETDDGSFYLETKETVVWWRAPDRIA